MEAGHIYTFWSFLSEFKITIPVIQRDYAQGRIGKEELRKRFLSSLFNALSENESLVLDFVYGKKEEDDCIIPLDGQQRLTTLWLLHWFVFLKSKNSDISDSLKRLRRFSYETRISSREFIDGLCNPDYFKDLRMNKSGIRNTIIKKTWFLKAWEQDPTVKAMLNMLGGTEHSIESIFSFKDSRGYTKFWQRLIDPECPIKFFYLSIENEIKQEDDDIYIKVNARGEHLTDFENFKADLIKLVRDDETWRSCSLYSNKSCRPELELSRLLDTTWTDVFWKTVPDHEKELSDDKPLPSIDQQFFAFLNRFFVNQIMLDVTTADELTGKKETDKTNKAKVDLFRYLYGKDGDADTILRYKDFDIYKNAGILIPKVFKSIQSLMYKISGFDSNTLNRLGRELDIISWQKSDRFCFFPELKKEVLEPITQIHRVVFYGICHYFESTDYSKDSFDEWMRFVWNMAKNSDVQTVGSMVNVIRLLSDIKHPATIIDELEKRINSDDKSYFERQLTEEVNKAKVYSQNKSLIIKAENAFHGSIRFLINELSDKSIEKAKNLVNHQNWYLPLLPYLQSEFSSEDKDPIVLGKDEDDVVRTINYNDKLVNAFNQYLKNGSSPDLKNDSWVYPLIMIPGLLEGTYTITRKIQVYEKNKVKGVYLFKASYWSEDSCILLFSFDQAIQKLVSKRNEFIVNQINNGYILCGENKENNQLIDEKNSNYGRAILISNNNNTFICAVDKYYDSAGNKYQYQ